MDQRRTRAKEFPRKKTKTPSEALASLMRLCSRGEKSSGDALRLMAGWGVAEAERGAVLEKLVENRFIDDRRFARAYVRDKMSFSGWGPYKISRGLAAKGISKEIISEMDAMISGGAQGDDRLYSMLEKKMNRTGYSDVYALKAKLVRYGAAQGYPYEEVLDAVEKILKGKNSYE